MAELTRADADLVYQYLNEDVRIDVEQQAYDAALEEFERHETLEAADNDPESSFSWVDISYEIEQRDPDRKEMVPSLGLDASESDEVYDAAHEFGWLVIDHIRDEIRRIQSQTFFAPREFVALVVEAEWDEENAATLMDITVGNFRGKKGDISTKLDRAEATLNWAERIRGQ